ncbi:MAG: ATP-binding cassette domain-containing protein [Clostridia bacterium]|nr:ATP-binding cassette domain-containing protein [Clostridia bacterium]
MHLEVQNLKKTFGEKQVLHGISFEVKSGKALGLLGRNGAGKTTTIRILMDLFESNEGTIHLNEKPFNPRNHQIGYLPEERGLYPKKKVIDQLLYLGELRGLEKSNLKKNALYWLERLGVTEYKDKKLETLSKGNQQKVQLASTFLCHPEIVILDEPFSGLDPVNSQILKEIIREQIENNKLVIFSSHQMSYVEEFCEEIALIDQGNVVLTGNLNNIKKNFGKNRLVLKLGSHSTLETSDLLNRHFVDLVDHHETKKDRVILKLKSEDKKHEFMKRLSDQALDVELFANYHPSLEDIFIESVGE